MRTILFGLLLLAVAYGGYRYSNDPRSTDKMLGDLANWINPTGKASPTPSPGSDTRQMVDQVLNPSPSNPVATSVNPVAPTDPEPKKWTPPAILPVQANWTWNTSDGKTYHNVKIVRIDADCVTILHSEGGGRVPIATLPADMQKYFNYDPVAAAETAALFDKGLAQERAAEAQEQPVGHPTDYFAVTDDYSSALAEAKADKKLLLLHFTGSDWCPYCKDLDNEVMNTAAFRDFAASNVIIVTVDFPHSFQLPDKVKEQNDSLSHKYSVNGFPTLVLTNTDGKDFGRVVGYEPGAGPDPIVGNLKGACEAARR